MNEFKRFRKGMRVVPESDAVRGTRGTILKRGTHLTVESVFDDDGRPALNFEGIRDSFAASNFREAEEPTPVKA